jgi:rSAM/selenodomain-associated transferase 1
MPVAHDTPDLPRPGDRGPSDRGITNGRCAIAVMAKAPRPGKVKTRLQPALTPDAAMALSAAFLRDITENIRLAAREAPIDGWIAYAPAGLEMLFHGMLASGTRLALADGAIEAPDGVQGFGRCLLHGARALFERHYDAVCLLNSDSPTLPTAMLVRAAQALAEPGDRVVLGPAKDGGYYVIGMKAEHAGLFADIAWSTGTVAAQTRERVAALGLELVELDAWYDVDDSAALQRLLADVAGGIGHPAPATVACLRALGLSDGLDDAAA